MNRNLYIAGGVIVLLFAMLVYFQDKTTKQLESIQQDVNGLKNGQLPQVKIGETVYPAFTVIFNTLNDLTSKSK